MLEIQHTKILGLHVVPGLPVVDGTSSIFVVPLSPSEVDRAHTIGAIVVLALASPAIVHGDPSARAGYVRASNASAALAPFTSDSDAQYFLSLVISAGTLGVSRVRLRCSCHV